MKDNKMTTYYIQAKLELIVSIETQAKNLDEALTKTKSLKEQDFVTIDGEYVDGNMRITGVYEKE